jgi:UDP-GlcNAc:undecaprenyl-phosphate GlcNAc-1-phosphate transferase
MESIYLSLICSFVIAIAAIPTIIRVSYLKHLYDVPDDRKAHSRAIPTLGGLAIFAGFGISLGIFAPENVPFITYQYLYAALLIIFFIGLQDDILIISPLKKLLGQIVAASLVVLLGGVKLTSMYGLFGIEELNTTTSNLLTIFTLLVVMNGFNLIDGINWLSAGVGIVVASAFGFYFIRNGHIEFAVISSSLIGGLLGFMWFNKTPAKIFMGDTGSLILGLLNGVLCIHFIEINHSAPVIRFTSAPIVAFGIMVVPLFDTLRVFFWRMMRGKSPLSPDRNHIHHRLLEMGFSHMASSGIIIATNIIFIILIYIFEDLNSLILLGIIIGVAATLSYIPSIFIKKNKKAKKALELQKESSKHHPLSKVS